jgi:hypothetical protein
MAAENWTPSLDLPLDCSLRRVAVTVQVAQGAVEDRAGLDGQLCVVQGGVLGLVHVVLDCQVPPDRQDADGICVLGDRIIVLDQEDDAPAGYVVLTALASLTGAMAFAAPGRLTPRPPGKDPAMSKDLLFNPRTYDPAHFGPMSGPSSTLETSRSTRFISQRPIGL